MKNKDTLLREIAGLASLVSRFPVPYQNNFVHNMECTMDQDSYIHSCQAFRKKKPSFKEAAHAVREKELGGTAAMAGVKQSLMDLFAPLVESDPEKLDNLIEISCSDIVHRRIWDAQDDGIPLAVILKKMKIEL